MTDPKTDVWMPLWIGSYLADTMKLTTVQHGAYFLLLMAYWRERSPLKDDDDELRSITKTERAEWKKMRPVIAEFFKVADGVWWHKRVEQEMAEADKRSKAAKEKAQKGADARWKDKPKDATGNAPSIPQAKPEDVPNQCPLPSPLPTELRSVKPTADAVVKKRRSALPADFYPNAAGLTSAGGLQLDQELEAFRNHHAAKGSLMLDWQAAFRTWTGNARKFSKTVGSSGEPGWRRDARQRMQEAVPNIAEKSGPPAHEFFELEAKNVTPAALGR